MSNNTLPSHVRVRETGKVGEVEELMHDGRYLVRFPEDEGTPAPTYGVYDRAALMSGWTETTGEHIQHKLADDLYQDFVSPKDVPEHHHALPELSDAQVDRLYEELSHRGPKRDWTPTPGEIGLAMGIIVFIIVLFLFIVFAYPGW
jgi:hypothetical protein